MEAKRSCDTSGKHILFRNTLQKTTVFANVSWYNTLSPPPSCNVDKTK